MADYIRPDNAIVIRSESRPFTRRLASRYHMYGISTWYTSAEDVFSAFLCASEMDRDTYAARSAAASRVVADQFGTEPLRAALNRISVEHSATNAGESG
jgi:hypothetical protein